MAQSKRWCFTHNNYANTDWFMKAEYTYGVFGKEVGESGTPHLQGFIIFKTNQRLSALKKKFPQEIHWEIAKGTTEQAITYCQKDGEWTERGDRPKTPQEKGAAEQDRWKRIREAAEQGNDEEIPEEIRFKHPRLVDYHRNKFLRTRELQDTNVRHEWYYGASGTGKSRKAREENPDAYLKMCNKWWGGYVDQDVVLIEDFDKEHSCLCHHLKIWADRYPFPAEIKGDQIVIRPKKIIVTSNYHPSDIWTDDKDLEPILRRFKLHHFS